MICDTVHINGFGLFKWATFAVMSPRSFMVAISPVALETRHFLVSSLYIYEKMNQSSETHLSYPHYRITHMQIWNITENKPRHYLTTGLRNIKYCVVWEINFCTCHCTKNMIKLSSLDVFRGQCNTANVLVVKVTRKILCANVSRVTVYKNKYLSHSDSTDWKANVKYIPLYTRAVP